MPSPKVRDPAVARSPRVRIRTLIETGTPQRGLIPRRSRSARSAAAASRGALSLSER
jgi:hypothetical protein